MGTKYYFLSKLYITVVVADESVDETYYIDTSCFFCALVLNI